MGALRPAVAVRAELRRGGSAAPDASRVGGVAGSGSQAGTWGAWWRGAGSVVGVPEPREEGGGGGGGRSWRERVGAAYWVRRGASPGLFFAAGAGFALFALALSLAGCCAVRPGLPDFKSLGHQRIFRCLAACQETELQTPRIKCYTELQRL